MCAIVPFFWTLQRLPMANVDDIPDSILERIQKCGLEQDGQVKLLYFLSINAEKGTVDPFIKTLRSASSDEIFEGVAKRLIDDINLAENQPEFRQFMQTIWTNYMKESESCGSDGQRLNFSADNKAAVPVSSEYVFLRAVSRLSPDNYCALLMSVKSVGTGSQLVLYAEKALVKARSAQPVVCSNFRQRFEIS